jgi:L-idonate 5-dehydrogenase
LPHESRRHHAAKDLRIEEREPEAPGPGQVEVAIGAGGICGSDLHYYNHGGFGTVRSASR